MEGGGCGVLVAPLSRSERRRWVSRWTLAAGLLFCADDGPPRRLASSKPTLPQAGGESGGSERRLWVSRWTLAAGLSFCGLTVRRKWEGEGYWLRYFRGAKGDDG